MHHYIKFFAMIVTSAAVMFGLMYLNTLAADHVFFSETRVYMALIMGAAMAAVMLAYMFKMYPSRKANAGIFAGGALRSLPRRCGSCGARRPCRMFHG